jgi:flagellar biosynthesis/type III secretory pathway protein FliH
MKHHTRVEQWEQAIRQESLEQGIEKGIEKGWKGGREEGESTMFCKMLEVKYGPLPQWALDKIAQADAITLEQWATRLFNAQTLDEVFNSKT